MKKRAKVLDVYHFVRDNPNLPDEDMAQLLHRTFNIPRMNDCRDVVKASRGEFER